MLQVGFLLGIIAEFNSAGPLLEQAKANPIPVVLVTIVFSWASLVPITKGARSEAFGEAFCPTCFPQAILKVSAIG